MIDLPDTPLSILQRRSEKLKERRMFFRKTSGFAAGMAGGVILTACGGGSNDAISADAPTDPEILNFALNLEYLEAQFYLYATTGAGLPDNLTTGTGTRGTVVGGTRVPFSDPVVAAYAKEIAADELAHVAFLRSALMSSAVVMPSIDIGGTDPNGAFSKAAQAAGLAPAGTAFNPYADDLSFLLGAYIFEDVGVTAYKGAAPLISNKTYLEAAAGILAAEAYHAGLVRTVLYSKGVDAQAAAGKISNARDSLDNTADVDQGIAPDASGASNIVPLDANGIAYSRTPGDVLNIVYLNSNAVDRGGFFPAGLNGTLVLSSALA